MKQESSVKKKCTGCGTGIGVAHNLCGRCVDFEDVPMGYVVVHFNDRRNGEIESIHLTNANANRRILELMEEFDNRNSDFYAIVSAPMG